MRFSNNNIGDLGERPMKITQARVGRTARYLHFRDWKGRNEHTQCQFQVVLKGEQKSLGTNKTRRDSKVM